MKKKENTCWSLLRRKWRSSSRRFAENRDRRSTLVIAYFPFFFPSFSSSFFFELELSISTYLGLWVFCSLGFVFIEFFFSFFWMFFFWVFRGIS